MTFKLDGDVVVITGAAGGLGAAYARLLARCGARVIVNDIGGPLQGGGGDLGAANQVAGDIRAAGGIAVGQNSDGSTVAGAQAIIASALEHFGRIDAVVANAGILRDRTFAKLSDEDFQAVVSVHLTGTMRVFHAAFGHMKEQGYGRLVATTSASGLYGNFGQSNYGAAKMGIVGLTRALAIEGARSGIKANAVAPAALTRMTEGLAGAPVGKMTPEQVAPVVAYLVSPACAVSGRIYAAGAGRVARVNVGVTRGLTNVDLTPEWVAQNIDAIDQEQPYLFPESAFDEASLFDA